MTKPPYPDAQACKTCQVGSCCYEGAELTAQELRRIIKFNPQVPKPWFRLVESHEDPDQDHPFTTLVRNGTCVFQDKNNRCRIYKVRPHHCKDFPFENGRTATHYKYLCVLFREEWGRNSNIRRVYRRREKK